MANYFREFLPQDYWFLAYLAAAAIHVGLLLTVALVFAGGSTWLERKVSGRIQDRLGPTRVGGRFGWLQALADGLKLIAKEDFMPGGADKLLFRAAPYISFCASFCVFLALPFADGWVAVRLNIAVFFILAVAGLEVFGVILGGYASASKWSLFGAMREAAQVVSYEVPLAFCAVIPVMVAGTMDLVEMGRMQQGWFTNWLVFHDPFLFLTFFVYLTCAVASVNRAPFDLAEAESELVAGFLTEYSGFRWSVFFMAEYASMTAVSGLAALLFFGGWNGPIPVAELLGLTYANHAVLGYLGNLLGLANFLLKCGFGILVMMWLRWTLPRLRIDQVMTTCLKYCFPLAAAMFLGVMVWSYAIPGRAFFGLLPAAIVSERSVQPEAPSPKQIQSSEIQRPGGSMGKVARNDALRSRYGNREEESYSRGGSIVPLLGSHLQDDRRPLGTAIPLPLSRCARHGKPSPCLLPLTPDPSPTRGEGRSGLAPNLSRAGKKGRTLA